MAYKEKPESGDSGLLRRKKQSFHGRAPIIAGDQFYLERPQLNALMERALNLPLVTVVAGAGYGKTQTVYSFLRDSPYTISWIQLSEWDNIEWRFWENAIMALSFSDKDLAAKLSSLGFPDSDKKFNRYRTLYRECLTRNIRYVVVFDDLHLIRSKAVLRFIEQSIDAYIGAFYRNITVILISRTEPAINTGKFFSRGVLTRITEEDLRFSREETGVYFQKQRISLPLASQSDLYRDTEGWVFAIHLVGLSLKKGSAAIDYGRSSLRLNLFKLIEEEVFSPLSEDLQKYLVKLSLIDHLAPELLAEIAAGEDFIEKMGQIGSFIRFDAYLNVYRIHHLFLEYLNGKQDRLTEAEKRDVYTKTARWCSARNLRIDAINCYEKAADYAGVSAEIYALPMVLPDQIARYVLRLLDRIPQEMYDQNPLIYTLRGRVQASLALFEEAVEEIEERIIPKFEALPPSSMNHRVLMGCYINLGYIGIVTSIRTGDLNFARFFEKALSHSRLSGYVSTPPASVASLGSYVCRVQRPEKGEPERYIEALSAAIPPAADALGGWAWGIDDLARAELAFFKGDLPGAERSALLALDKARERDQYEVENQTLFYLLRINLARGNYEEVRHVIAQLEAQLTQAYYLNRFIYHDIIMGWYYTQIGQAERLVPWLKNDFEESSLNSLVRGLELMVKAKYQFYAKRYPAALALLENREDLYGDTVFLMGRIEWMALEAVCRYQDRDQEGAFAALQRAYELAQPNAMYMPFMELGKTMRTLTGAALKNGAAGIPPAWLERVHRHASSYAQKVFTAAEKHHDSRESSPKKGTALSRREMAVLTGLSRGLTREEIALDGNISVNTVKSAIRSVYNKLGAVNRADAVRIAGAQGILKQDGR
jgi:LuxR family maltose regulon positive regulatory protein